MEIRGIAGKTSEGLILGFRRYLLFLPRSFFFDCSSLPWRMMKDHELGEDLLNVFWVNVWGYTVRAEISYISLVWPEFIKQALSERSDRGVSHVT